MDQKQLDNLAVAAIRATCIDEINKAKSGHPGMALGSAPILYALFTRHLVATPTDSKWINRDRFVLSAGHASALYYVMLHLCGYKISMDDLKSFRQLNSMTPGHPECNLTDGIDATSGPLGQGIAQAVGMALAEKMIQNQYTKGETLMNHYTYCLCGDGCLQEGLSQEAISFAGHQHLNKLILIYDSNNITLDGSLELSNSESVSKRFKADKWDVIEIQNGNSVDDISSAIEQAKKSQLRPTLIIVNTVIGYGSEKEGTNKVHGNPLGEEDGMHAKLNYKYNYPPFTIPSEVYDYFKQSFAARGLEAYNKYNKSVKKYIQFHADEYDVFTKAIEGDVSNLFDGIFEYKNQDSESTRNTSGKVLNFIAKKLPYLVGGSADVAGSVMTKIEGESSFLPINPKGKSINFGIREFAMASIQNGMLLHKGLKTYVGSFFVFSDYMRSAIRMSALADIPAVYLFSHDSIAVGEDGPTHQPIEHLASLRAMPNLNVIRPCDARETIGAWKVALESKETPTAIILSRQNLTVQNASGASEVEKGAYIVSKETKKPQVILLASGSEVELLVKTQEALLKEGIDSRVVSMPSNFLFEKQDKEYKKSVLSLEKSKIFAVEMGSTQSWYKYADNVYGIDTFGKSAPAKDVISYYGFTVENMVKFVKENM